MKKIGIKKVHRVHRVLHPIFLRIYGAYHMDKCEKIIKLKNMAINRLTNLLTLVEIW